MIANIIANTAAPTMLWVQRRGHIVLAYDVYKYGETNESPSTTANYPGTKLICITSTEEQYCVPRPLHHSSGRSVFTDMVVQGSGSWQLEPFDLIYKDAENGFNGSGAAQVDVTSFADLDHVLDRTVMLSGVSPTAKSGGVSRVMNGETSYRGAVDSTGNFSIPISLHADTNELKF